MASLQPTFSLKQAVIHDLLDHIYHLPQKTLNSEVAEIAQLNARAHHNDQTLFSFRDGLYSDGNPQMRKPFNLLHRSLRDAMKAYLERKEKLEREQAMVRGFLQDMVATFNHIEIYIEVLPDTLGHRLRNYRGQFPELTSEYPAALVEAFLRKNQKYLGILTTRMTYNLLGAPNL